MTNETEYNPRTGEWDPPMSRTGGMSRSNKRVERAIEEQRKWASLTDAEREAWKEMDREYQKHLINYEY